MTKVHKHKDVIIAWANGETIQFWGGDRHGWLDVLEPNFNSDAKFRVKPKTISINGLKVPEPIRTKPKRKTTYYVPDVLGYDFYLSDWWSDTGQDLEFLNLGLIHLTKEAAIQHAKALLSFTAKEDN